MTIDEIKSLEKGDIITNRVRDSHNNSLFVYRVEASENRPIGWVVIVVLMYKIDEGRRIFINKRLGYSPTDDEIRFAEKAEKNFLRMEIERVFNGG